MISLLSLVDMLDSSHLAADDCNFLAGGVCKFDKFPVEYVKTYLFYRFSIINHKTNVAKLWHKPIHNESRTVDGLVAL